jgi:hypothetical protein
MRQVSVNAKAMALNCGYCMRATFINSRYQSFHHPMLSILMNNVGRYRNLTPERMSSISNAKKLGSLETNPILTMDILSDDFIESSMYLDLDFLSHLTAFLPSQAEIERIWRPSSLESWLEENAVRYKCHMVAKLGERGSLVCEASTGVLSHVPALPAKVRDTTGAGDGYCGGFIAGLAAGRSLVGCAAMATVSSSYVVEACGALATEQPTAQDKIARLQLAEAAIRPTSSSRS